jgi:hypothetical protein
MTELDKVAALFVYERAIKDAVKGASKERREAARYVINILQRERRHQASLATLAESLNYLRDAKEVITLPEEKED